MINRTIVQGRMIADPEIKALPSGALVANFRIAWSEKFRTKDGNEGETKLFLNCQAWRGTAEFIGNYFKKGQEICVEGSLATRQFETNGEKRSTTELTVEKAHFCGSKASNEGNAQVVPSGEGAFSQATDVDDSDVPF